MILNSEAADNKEDGPPKRAVLKNHLKDLIGRNLFAAKADQGQSQTATQQRAGAGFRGDYNVVNADNLTRGIESNVSLAWKQLTNGGAPQLNSIRIVGEQAAVAVERRTSARRVRKNDLVTLPHIVTRCST